MKDGDRELSSIGAVKITGRIETLPGDRRRLTFDSVRDGMAGSDTHSTAIFSADGEMLEGETIETLTYEGEERSFSYSWKARAEGQ